jgi:hypothetical protein
MFQMAAFNIQEALLWKEKIELVIDQVYFLHTSLIYRYMGSCGKLICVLDVLFDIVAPITSVG